MSFKKWKKSPLKKEKTTDIEFFSDPKEENEKNHKENLWSKLPKKKTKSKNATNRNIFLNFRRRKTLQIIKYLEGKEIFNSFFYTDSNNLSIILEQGIQATSKIKLLTQQEYVVWTYLQHNNYLELELGNSTRHFFWKWCAQNNVDLTRLAIISIDLNRLFQFSNKDWNLDLELNRLQIFETIPIEAIDWILLKDKRMIRLAEMYIKKQNLKIKLFQSNNGEIIN